MTHLPLSHREVNLELLDPENEYIRRIRERHASKSAAANVQVQISEVIDRTDEFSSSASEWTTDRLCQLQVVVVDDQLDSAMFPGPYIVSDEDKTLIAVKEDGYFVPECQDVMVHAWNSKMHNNFFIDLMQILNHRVTTRISSTSPQPSTPNTASDQNKTKATIQKILQNAKRPTPISRNTKSSSYSLIHNFLKYIASMEHLAHPNFPFWCPSADSEWFPIISSGMKFFCFQDGSINVWVRNSKGNVTRNPSPICFIECKTVPPGSSADVIAPEVADLIAFATQNWHAKSPAVRPRDEAFVVCCSGTLFHISAAIVIKDYLTGIMNDSLPEDHYLIVKKGRVYDLSDPTDRYNAVKQTLALMRYLTRFPLQDTDM